MSHYRLQAGPVLGVPVLGVPAVLMLAFTVGCGPNQETGAEPAKTATASAAPSATATPNGVGKLAAAQILDRARKATASAEFLRMRARLADGGGQMSLDFRYAGKAKATGSFTQGGQRVEVTRIGSTVYIKGNNAFYKAIGGAGAVQMFRGKYLKTTAGNADFKELAAFTDRTGLLDEIVKAEPTWKKGENGTSGGAPSVTLTSPAGDEMHVAAQGPPYVLSVDGGSQGLLEYLAYGKPVDVRRPPAGAVVDVDKLE